MFHPSKEEFIKLAKNKNYNLISVWSEITNDELTPISIFKKLEQESKYAYLLESVESGENLGRYTFIGIDPFSIISYDYKTQALTIKEDKKNTIKTSEPFLEIKKYLSKFRLANKDSLPPFLGGAVGYVGYDIVRTIEHLPNIPKKDVDVPDLVFMLSDTVIIFDHLKHKIMVCATAFLGRDVIYNVPAKIDDAYEEAKRKIYDLIENKIGIVSSDKKLEFEKNGKAQFEPEPVSNFKKEDFKKAVLKCKEYIKAGDILQGVISQRFQKQITCPPFDIYRSLRSINPSPYMFYLKMNDFYLLGSSPETMVKVIDKTITTKPIAGTRKRGKDNAEDDKLSKELLADEKECAEHIMLVDLGRNDVGKVSEKGSVKVTEFMNVEKYSHVMHIVSDVEGKLSQDKDIYDAINAIFPAGTVSGAPKIRAMEIIDELEPTKRGPYAGLVGYISWTGDLDTCITIRTILCKDNVAYVQAGAGIVADSDPEKEYEETVNKAMGLLQAIE